MLRYDRNFDKSFFPMTFFGQSRIQWLCINVTVASINMPVNILTSFIYTHTHIHTYIFTYMYILRIYLFYIKIRVMYREGETEIFHQLVNSQVTTTARTWSVKGCEPEASSRSRIGMHGPKVLDHLWCFPMA